MSVLGPETIVEKMSEKWNIQIVFLSWDAFNVPAIEMISCAYG